MGTFDRMAARRPGGTERFALAAGALVAVLGVTMLLGSAFEVDALLRWVPTWPSTTVLTATSITGIGLALVLRSWSRPLAVVADGSALAVVAVGLVEKLSGRIAAPVQWWYRTLVGADGPVPLPAALSLLAVASLGLGLLLALVGRPRWAQPMAALTAALSSFVLLSFAYGDQVDVVLRSSFPDALTSAPTAVALLAGSLAVFAITARTGAVAWILADSPGRNAVRRLLPAVVAIPLVLAAVARRSGIERSLGPPRAWALVMGVVALGICVVAVAAVGVVDRLAAAANRAQLTEVRLAVALRDARVAEVARRLALAVGPDEVAQVVDEGSRGAVGARAASFGILDLRRRVLRMHHGTTVPDSIRGRFSEPSLDEPLLLTEVVRTGVAAFAHDAEDYRQRYPGSEAVQPGLGLGSRAGLPLVDRSGGVFGVLVMSWDEQVDFDDGLVPTLHTLAELVSRALERAQLVGDLSRDASRATALAELAEALAVASSRSEVLDVLVAHAARPAGGVDAAVGLLEEGGRVVRRYVAPGSAASSALEATSPIDADSPLVEAVRTGRSVLVGERADAEEMGAGPLARFDALGFGATANLPLRGRDGQPFGALGLAWADAVEFDVPMQTLLATIAELAAQALQRAWLGDERERDAQRAVALARMAESFAAASTSAQLAAVVAAEGPALVGARSVELRLAGAGFGDPGDESRTDPAELVIPVMSPDDQLELGRLAVGWPASLDADDATLAVLSTVAELVSQTLDRVRLAESEHRLAADLQQRTLRPVPAVAGLAVAARYEPAAAELGMGGDWFEVLALPDGRAGLVVGDVVGHGVDAAGEMSQLSAVLSTLLRVGTPLESFFARVHEVAGTAVPQFLATAVVATIDPASGEVEYVSAGHPPLALVDAAGSTTFLEGARVPVLGIAAPVLSPARARLDPGDTLVAYTDGLVERRAEELDTGLERLRLAIRSTHDGPVERFADDLLVRCVPPEHRREDDVALVVIRRA